MANLGEFGAAERETDPTREPDTFTFYGETFTVKPKVGSMPLLRFAAVAQSGAEAEGVEGLAAMYRLITSCVVPDDVERFEKSADDNDVDIRELMNVCMTLYAAITGRPTEQPSDSAPGSSSTTESSRAASSSKALSPIQADPRVQELVSVRSASLQLVG